MAKSIKLAAEVHSATVDQAEVEATVKGKARTVLAEVLTVELLVGEKVVTLQFDDVEEAEKMFMPGDDISITLTGAKS